MATDKHLKTSTEKHLRAETDGYPEAPAGKHAGADSYADMKPEMAVKDYGIGRQLLIYTLLFAVAALGAYSFYIIGGTVFITDSAGGNKDGIAQIIPSYIAVKHIVQGVLAGDGFSAWNWSIGLGSDNWNQFASKLANPFTYLIIAAPEDKIDLSYTLVSVFRQYCVGLAFLFFGRKVKLTGNQNIIGALCYAFSMWMILTIPDQAGFNTAALLFPLLMLGAEKIIDKESPFIFIIAVFYFLTAGVVWGYASGIMIVIYFFLRMIMKGSLKEPKEFFATTGRFMLSGIAGVLIASFFVSEILMSMSAATTDTGSGKETWFSIASYMAVPKSLYVTSTTGAASYSGIGLPIVGVLLMPMIVRNMFRGRIEALMSVLLLAGTQIPAVCRMFNGFSYPSGRWFYMVAFFTAWAAAACFTVETFRSRLSCIVMELWLMLTAGWMVYRYMVLERDSRKIVLAVMAGFMFGTAIIILGHIRAILTERAGGTNAYGLARGTAIVLIMLITVLDIVEIGVYDSYTHDHAGVPGHAHVGEAYDAVLGTSESVMPAIQESDGSFYRYDRKGGYYGIRTVGAVINNSIALGTRPVYTCFSTAPGTWHEYNKAVGNCTGNYRRTLIDSNDGRAMLDYLMGVKYFIGSPSDPEVERNQRASLYVPYGYGEAEDIDGYEVFTNKYCMGLGTSYPQYITESEFSEYPVYLREQVLMQAAVVPDSYADRLANVKHAAAADIHTDCEEVDIEVDTTSDDIQIDLEKGTLNVDDKERAVKVHTGAIKDRQLIVAFENFRLEGTGLGEKPGFKIKTMYKRDFRGEKRKVWKGTKSEAGGIRSFNDIDSFYINLGYFEESPEMFKVYLNKKGSYAFDTIKVYAVPMDGFDRNAGTLDSRRFEISEWDDDFAKGTMTCAEDSIMYFSILENKGWNIYVDGGKADKIKDVNISFTGAMLPAGEHEVELRYVYPYKYMLYASTAAGLLLAAVLIIRNILYKRRTKGQGTD